MRRRHLQPHRVHAGADILYTKHDEVYLDAVAIARDGQAPREVRLGTFKVAGLSDVKVGDAGFEPESLFDPGDGKYQGVTLFAVDG